MCAMAEEETIFTSLMNFRFEGDDEDVGGHNLGNLILTAMTQTSGGFMEAIRTFSKFLKVKRKYRSLLFTGHYVICHNGRWYDCTRRKQYSRV